MPEVHGTMWAVVTGNLQDGFTLYGVFTEKEDAIAWAEKDLYSTDWSLVRVYAPKAEQ